MTPAQAAVVADIETRARAGGITLVRLVRDPAGRLIVVYATGFEEHGIHIADGISGPRDVRGKRPVCPPPADACTMIKDYRQ